MKILLADDEREILEIYSAMLRGNGHEVICALDGKEALDLLAEGVFDLLVLDLFMPNLDGFKTLQTLRRQGQAIPVIVMTGHYPNAVVAERIRGLKVAQVLRKPVTISELLHAVNQVVSSDS